ncbi:hypothetical protein NL676_017151 [Syzygium grande]|nr:hypothetical protein NL676_017151 [Syzygium grande]
MASQFAILAIVALVALPSVALATQWTIGDDNGWTINYNYTKLKITVVDNAEGPAPPPAAPVPSDETSSANTFISSSFKILAAAVVALVPVSG